jgi:hypothetical protein
MGFNRHKMEDRRRQAAEKRPISRSRNFAAFVGARRVIRLSTVDSE